MTHTHTLPPGSSLGESVSGVGEEVPGKGEDLGRETNPRPSLSTAAHLPPTLRRLRPSGDHCSKSFLYNPQSLQVTIWGDYGRVEGSKVFMGVAQILLDNLDLSHIVSIILTAQSMSAMIINMSGDWLVQAVRHILVSCGAPWGREGGPSIATFASGTSAYQPNPPSAPRARQDEALTPLLLLLLPPHPPHQNHHFPYFHCISSPPFKIAHSALRHKRVQKRFWAPAQPTAGWQSSSLPKLFIFTDQYILQH